MSERDILFELSSGSDRLIITHNLIGQLVLSVEGCGIRAAITFHGAVGLYELSDWIERHLDGNALETTQP